MTEEQEAQIAMFMRVAEVFRKYEDVINTKPEIVAAAKEFKSKIQDIFDLLTEEERNRALEKYKEDLAYINQVTQNATK